MVGIEKLDSLSMINRPLVLNYLFQHSILQEILRVGDLEFAEQEDRYSFKVRFLGDSSELRIAASGAEGMLLLNPKTGMIAFHDSSSPSSTPMVSYNGKDISDISAEASGKIRKKQILAISFEEKSKYMTVRFEILGAKANAVAAALLSFRNEIESIKSETKPIPHEPKQILGSLGEIAHSLEKTIGNEVQKISATVQESLASLTKLDQLEHLGKKLKLNLNLQDSPEETTINIDEFVNAAENSGIFEAIFGALMTKGMISAANEDWKTSLKALKKARDEAHSKKMESQASEADRQIKRIEALSSETEIDPSSDKEVSMDEAHHYLEGVDQIISEWEKKSQAEGEEGNQNQ